VDFAGPWDPDDEPAFRENETAKYLGTWTKESVYERLTEYSCLVLLSESEASPKVVIEAMAAGVSVVITEPCSLNLSPEPFITVLPDGESRPEAISEAIQLAIERNQALRPRIRAHAVANWGYDKGIENYLRIIDEFRQAVS
jgi:glycosyltransferase involved in cell wall biosynthesis